MTEQSAKSHEQFYLDLAARQLESLRDPAQAYKDDREYWHLGERGIRRDMNRLPVYTYALVDPLTREVAYVGTTIDPSRARRKYTSDTKVTTNFCLDLWRADLRSRGEHPDLYIIGVAVEHKPNVRAADTIARFVRLGEPLLNRIQRGPLTPWQFVAYATALLVRRNPILAEMLQER